MRPTASRGACGSDEIRGSEIGVRALFHRIGAQSRFSGVGAGGGADAGARDIVAAFALENPGQRRRLCPKLLRRVPAARPDFPPGIPRKTGSDPDFLYSWVGFGASP